MWIIKAALTAILAQSPPVQPAITAYSGPELVRAIKADLESISGAGTVEVKIDRGTAFTARIAVPAFNLGVCTKIYDREVELRQLFPDLNFDFYFDGPELARAIQTELESITGRGTVDVSIDSKTLFSVRVAVPGFSTEIYSRIFDRELELYQTFRDLNFDFYLHPVG